MTQTENQRDRRIGWRRRTALALLGFALATPLLAARLLTPSPRGYGTHEQLGLPPCSIRLLTGRRCPACGMTTSLAHLVRGQLVPSVEANAAGTLFGLFLMGLAPWCWYASWSACAVSARSVERLLAVFAAVFSVVTLATWVLRLMS